MKKGARSARSAQLVVRLQRLTREIEELVLEIETALADGYDSNLLSPGVRSFERAAAAMKALVGRANPRQLTDEIRGVLEGTSPLYSLLRSRLVLAGAGRGTSRTPSVGAQALAILLEQPGRTFDASEIAERLGCSVPIARTTLNRLVRSGHATRPVAGRFRANTR
jgi:hypothetical protein